MFIVQATDLVIEKDAVDTEEGLHRSARDDLLPDFGRPRRDGRSAGFSLPPVGNVEEDLNLVFYQDGFIYMSVFGWEETNPSNIREHLYTGIRKPLG